MNTTILIKTDKHLKTKASKIAKELGISLTTVINAQLGQFVREKKLTLSLEPSINPKKMKELVKISDDMDKGKNIGIKTDNHEELFKYLNC